MKMDDHPIVRWYHEKDHKTTEAINLARILHEGRRLTHREAPF